MGKIKEKEMEKNVVCFTITKSHLGNRWWIETRDSRCKMLNREDISQREVAVAMMDIATIVNNDYKLGCIFDCA